MPPSGIVAELFRNAPNRLTVIKEGLRRVSGRNRTWCLCRCICGNEKWIIKTSLKHTRSCGCLHSEISREVGRRSKTHGESRCSQNHQPEYTSWEGMLKRCYNPSHESYPRYGGSGITVCEEWRESYEKFLAHVGRKPSPRHSIDRWPNPNGNYEPGNVRWADPKQQQRNRKVNVMLTFRGETHCIAEWEEILGVPKDIIGDRIRSGLSVERALTLPYVARSRKHAH